MRKTENRIWDWYGVELFLAHPVMRFVLAANRLASILPDTHARVIVRVVDVIPVFTHRFHNSVCTWHEAASRSDSVEPQEPAEVVAQTHQKRWNLVRRNDSNRVRIFQRLANSPP
jgi:hypothetical protein